jgi:hypothetical protein
MGEPRNPTHISAAAAPGTERDINMQMTILCRTLQFHNQNTSPISHYL